MLKVSVMTYTLMAGPKPCKVEEMPDVAARAGVHAINWVSTYGLNPQLARRMTLDAGLAVGCYTNSLGSYARAKGEAAALEEAKRLFDETVGVGAPCIMLVPLPFDDLPDRDEARRRWCGFLPRLAELAHQAGVILTIENYQGAASPFVRAAELMEAVKAVPDIRFTFDAGNAATGEDPVKCAKGLEGRIEYVHLKDWTCYDEPGPGRLPGLTGKYYVDGPIGEGCVDIIGTLRELARQNYNGYADIEYIGTKYLPVDEVFRAAKWLKETGLAE